MTRRTWACAALGLLLGISPAKGGSFLDVAECNLNSGCVLGVPATQHPLCDPNCEIPPFAITHPFGFTGPQTTLQIRICVDAASSQLEPGIQRAITKWEAMLPTTGNCAGCVLWEETPPPQGNFYADTTILHELGHCAVGLDHVNRLWDADNDGTFESTSFTLSAEAFHPGGIDDGPDDIRGSNDDFHTGPVGGQPAESVSWFRRADNDPFIVDATVIDESTFSRSVTANLPPGHTWAANGNRLVGESLGYSDSQAVMYSRGVREHYYSSLGADDVNMVKMGMTGVDLMSGTGFWSREIC
jgi:hypothetical protein